MSLNNPILSIPGMVSGLPTQSLIQSLVAARQAAEVPLQNQQAQIQKQITAWNGLTPVFQSFQNALQTLVNPGTWNAMTVSSSNSTAISASVSNGATAGTYIIESDQLAQAQTSVSKTFSSASNVGVSGTFQIVQGTGASQKTATITVNNGDSLQTIASAINTAAATNQMNIKASVLTNADGSAQLMISSTQTGTANAFTVTDTSGNFVSNTLQLQTTMAAQDAQAKINGTTVTSSTNTFSNIIGGLSFTLNQAGGTPPITSIVTVSADTSKITNAVNGFISAYNSLIQTIQADTKFDTSGAGNNGPLAGDTILQGIMFNLQSAVGDLISNSGKLTGLGQIGIVLNTDGTLGFSTADSTNGGIDGKAIFNDLLSSSLNDLKSLFGVVSTDNTTPTTGLGGLLNNIITSATDPVNGSIINAVNSLNSQNQTIQDELNQYDQANQLYQEQLQAQFNAMEIQISALKSQQQWLSQFAFPSMSSSSSSSSSNSSQG